MIDRTRHLQAALMVFSRKPLKLSNSLDWLDLCCRKEPESTISAFGYARPPLLLQIPCLQGHFCSPGPQSGTADHPLRRLGREVHYPPGVVDVQDPFILLVHQGMVEEIFLDDLKLRGVEVVRSTPYSRHTATENQVEVECTDPKTGQPRILKSQYLVGCDGAHSKVRKGLVGADYDGER